MTSWTARGTSVPSAGDSFPKPSWHRFWNSSDAFRETWADPAFRAEFTGLLQSYSGRPTPLTRALRLAEAAGVAAVYLKREDLGHTGSHKINNALGQALLAKRMGKHRVIAETGAGQHGVASATVCALLGLDCTVYMGECDMARQAPNVARMRLLGARVQPVSGGQATLKEAIASRSVRPSLIDMFV